MRTHLINCLRFLQPVREFDKSGSAEYHPKTAVYFFEEFPNFENALKTWPAPGIPRVLCRGTKIIVHDNCGYKASVGLLSTSTYPWICKQYLRVVCRSHMCGRIAFAHRTNESETGNGSSGICKQKDSRTTCAPAVSQYPMDVLEWCLIGSVRSKALYSIANGCC